MAYLMTPTRKARLTLDYLKANGGALPEEVMDQFLIITISQSDFLKAATTRKMKSETFRIPMMKFGSRALHKRTRGQALTDAKRTTPTVSKATITAYDYGAEITLEREDLKTGVQGPAMLNMIMKRITERVKLDWAELALNSVVGSADDDLDNYDGFVAGATSNAISASSTRFSRANATALLKSIPQEHRNANLAVWTSTNAVIDLKNEMKDRWGNLGEQAIQGRWKASFDDFPVHGDMVIPQNLGGGTNETTAVMGDPKQFNIGIHQDMYVDDDKDIRAGTIFVVFTLRQGAKYAVEPSMAKQTAILAS